MQKTTTSNKFDVLSHSIENDGISNTAHESSNESDSPSILQQQTGNHSTKSRQTRADKAKFKNKNPADHKTSAHKSSKLAFIAGDSIVQNVNGWQLSNSEQRVSVRSFSGSKTEDMKDYIKPLIRKKPDTIILHIGTNDIKDHTKSAEVVAAEILNLGFQIKDNLPYTKICISGITVRKDKAAIQNKIKEVNDILRRVCGLNNWTYIENSDIDYSCLNIGVGCT